MPPRLPPAAVERQFLDAERRAKRHWYEDGLTEIGIGGIFVVLALYFGALGFAAARLGRVASVLVNLLMPVIVLAGGLGMRRLLRRAKEQLVYPRAGYATYPRRRNVPRWVTAAIAGAIAGLTTALVRTAPGVDAWIPAFQGFLVAGFLLWLGRFAGLPRFSLLGLIAGLAGVGISLLQPDSNTAGALFFGAVGVALVVSGSLALRRFMGQAEAGE